MTNQEIANTIWHQITVATKMAVGARQAEATKNGLRFVAGGGSPKKWITVRLTAADEYDVEYVRSGTSRNAYEPTTLAKVEGIYVDQLNDIIYDMVNKQSYAVAPPPRKPAVRRSLAERENRLAALTRAFEIGQQAFREGRKSVPILDPALMEFLKAYSGEPGHDDKLFERLLTAWAKGWNAENAKRVRTAFGAGGKKRHAGGKARHAPVCRCGHTRFSHGPRCTKPGCFCYGFEEAPTCARCGETAEYCRCPGGMAENSGGKRRHSGGVVKQVAELNKLLK